MAKWLLSSGDFCSQLGTRQWEVSTALIVANTAGDSAGESELPCNKNGP